VVRQLNLSLVRTWSKKKQREASEKLARAVGEPPVKPEPPTSGAGSGVSAGSSGVCAGRGSGELPPATPAARIYRAFGFRRIPPRGLRGLPQRDRASAETRCAGVTSAGGPRPEAARGKDPVASGGGVFFVSAVFEAGATRTEPAEGGLWLSPEDKHPQQASAALCLPAERSPRARRRLPSFRALSKNRIFPAGAPGKVLRRGVRRPLPGGLRAAWVR